MLGTHLVKAFLEVMNLSCRQTVGILSQYSHHWLDKLIAAPLSERFNIVSRGRKLQTHRNVPPNRRDAAVEI